MPARIIEPPVPTRWARAKQYVHDTVVFAKKHAPTVYRDALFVAGLALAYGAIRTWSEPAARLSLALVIIMWAFLLQGRR